MTPDIFAAIQTYTDTQSLFPATNGTNATDSNDGQFEAIMTEFIADTEEAVIDEVSTLLQAEDTEELITFTGNNSFVRSVIDILAGSNEPDASELQEETAASSEDNLDAVVWSEDEPQVQAEDVKPEIDQVISDVAVKVKNFVSDKLKEVLPEDVDVNALVEEYIHDDKELDEVISRLTDEVKQETLRVIDDIAESLKHEDGQDTQPVVKMLEALAENISPKTQPSANKIPSAKVEDEDDNDELTDDMPVSTQAAELAGLEGITITDTTQQVQNPESEQDTQPDVDTSPRRNQQTAAQSRQVRTAQAESHVPTQEQQEAPEAQDNAQNFREVLEARAAERENAEPQDSDNQTPNQNQNFSQGRQEAGARDSSSSSTRSRNDSRRVDARTTTERTDSSSTTHRTESRSDFQAYFEGVLSSRRSASTSSPLPLSLRSTESFTQSSILRDGLTNVVRFIRADGVQKARVIVDPPALGRISVELTSGTSGVEASIKVASEQIRQLVQDQLSQLRMNLSQQGVQVAEFTVDVFTGQQDNSGSQNQQGQYQRGQNTNIFGDDSDNETEEFRVDLEDGLLYWVA